MIALFFAADCNCDVDLKTLSESQHCHRPSSVRKPVKICIGSEYFPSCELAISLERISQNARTRRYSAGPNAL